MPNGVDHHVAEFAPPRVGVLSKHLVIANGGGGAVGVLLSAVGTMHRDRAATAECVGPSATSRILDDGEPLIAPGAVNTVLPDAHGTATDSSKSVDLAVPQRDEAYAVRIANDTG